MTVYALRLENGTDTAARVRKADALGLAPSGNVSARGGIRPGPDAAVVAVTAGTMQVTVQPFLAFVDGGISDAQGGYPFVSDAVETLTLADGHGTLSRTDVIAAVVRDSAFDSSGALEAAVEVVQGTPGAGVPSLPTNAVALRNVVVPAGASLGTGGLSSGALSTDRRTWLSGLGGVIPVASQTERDTLPEVVPTLVYRTDTDSLEVRRASGWSELGPPSAAGSVFMVLGTTVASVTFPAGRFTAAPTVTLTPTGTANVAMVANVANVTAAGCDVYLYPNSGTWTDGNVSVYWHASEAH